MVSSCIDGDLLEAYDSGRLSGEEAEQVAAHVSDCESCRQRMSPLTRSATHDGERRVAGAGFSTGEVLAGRYRVESFIARGGMGEVYRAHDLELGQDVALKTLTGERASDMRAVERMRREVQLARRIAHPNVCRVFDLGFHARAGGAVRFLTMEL